MRLIRTDEGFNIMNGNVKVGFTNDYNHIYATIITGYSEQIGVFTDANEIMQTFVQWQKNYRLEIVKMVAIWNKNHEIKNS